MVDLVLQWILYMPPLYCSDTFKIVNEFFLTFNSLIDKLECMWLLTRSLYLYWSSALTTLDLEIGGAMYWLSTNSAFSFYLLHLPYQPLTLSIEVPKIRVAGTHMSQLLSVTSKTALYISLKCFPLCYFTIFLKTVIEKNPPISRIKLLKRHVSKARCIYQDIEEFTLYYIALQNLYIDTWYL